MKYFKKILIVLFILCVPLFCVSFTFNREFSTTWFYTYGFQKYNISQATGFSDDDLNMVADKFVEYFNSSTPDIFITVDGWQGYSIFNQQETLHFKDVKDLFNLDQRIMFLSLGGLILGVIWWQRRNWPALGKALITGSILTAALLMVLVVGINTDFDSLFLDFHVLAFSNNYWSAPGYMTVLFPESFWNDMAYFSVIITTVTAAVFGIIGYVLMKYTRKRNEIKAE